MSTFGFSRDMAIGPDLLNGATKLVLEQTAALSAAWTHGAAGILWIDIVSNRARF